MAEQTTPVPTSIHFSKELWVFPSFRDANLPEIANYGFAATPLSVGQWVNRGDSLLTMTYHFFDMENKPRWFFQNDDLNEVSINVTAPVCGVVLQLRDDYLGYVAQDSKATNSGDFFVYGRLAAWPVLLLPADEPPDDEGVSYFFERVARVVTDRPDRMLHGHRDGPRRFKESFPPDELRELCRRQIVDIPRYGYRRAFDRSDQGLVDTIQRLRGRDLTLRDKLLHLVKDGSPTGW